MSCVHSKSMLNRFVNVDTPRPRDMFSSALSLNNRGLYSPDDEIPSMPGRKLDTLADLEAFDTMMQEKESSKTE